jgi:D-alanyl-D-alanine carboxypeptidase/D-alanyl-D-alanine-endopeptidase (penicillin-binding protein 4)
MGEKVLALLDAVRHYGGKLGMSIVDLRNGKTIMTWNADKAFNPASNAKLVTAWAALKAFGPEYRYLTGLYGYARDGRVEQLVLRGEGDPSLELSHLYAMAAELHRSGVRKIGDIIVDQSRFDDQQQPPAFEQQPDEWASFRAPVAAVSLDGNTVMFTVYPTKPGEAARIQPLPASMVDVSGSVSTVFEKKPETIHLELKPLKGGRLNATFSGSIPVDSDGVKIWRRVDDPSLLAGHALADVCRQLGIKIQGQVRRGHLPNQKLLVARRSEPLAKLLHALGKHSDNFYAEMVFKSLGGEAGPASFETARARVVKLLSDARFDTSGLRFDNGSGLFDADRLTPAFVTSLLASAARDPSIGPELLAQLAIGGVDGTLRNRFEPFAPLRTIRAKTGTLKSVSTLGGYVLGQDGRPVVAFSFMVNGLVGASVSLRQEIDDVVAAASYAASL